MKEDCDKTEKAHLQRAAREKDLVEVLETRTSKLSALRAESDSFKTILNIAVTVCLVEKMKSLKIIA